MSGNRIVVDKQFYLQEDVVQIARQLLGKRLLSRIEGVVTGGIITETEAYAGITDKAPMPMATAAVPGRKSCTARADVLTST